MNPISRLVYRLLQGVAAIANTLYFRKIAFINRQYLAEKGPLIVISNHPNTVVDPLLAVMYTREPCFLLANYGLFKNPISGAILRTLFCIPVKRVKDVAEGEMRNNDDAFRESEEHLTAGRSLFVAAEGSSYTERHIRTFKTGAARILFEAESRANFTLNVRILPIGLTYSDPLKFGSDVVVQVGKPFSAINWQSAYVENPQQAVDDFTQYIENQFDTLTINCANMKEDHFLQKLETILQSEKPLDVVEKSKNTEGSYFRSKKLLAALQNWKKTDALESSKFEKQVNTYFLKLNALNLKDVNPTTFPASKTLGKFIMGLPGFVVGLLPNALPAWLSHSLVKWLKLDAAYDTTVRMLAGLVLFPLIWWLETEVLFAYFFPKITDLSAFYTLLLIFFYAASGLLAWQVYTEGSLFLNFKKYKRADSDGALTALRAPLIEIISDLKFEISEIIKS